MSISLDSKVRVRFAPSPTGTLHIGSARTALFNYLFARHHGGRFVLRVEDTDVSRSEERFEQSIIRDLRWLGLKWDEGPDRGGPFGPYRQSVRRERYRAAAERLLTEGKAYRCFCTEERLSRLREKRLAAGEMPKYDRHCLKLPVAEVSRRMAAGMPAAIRLLVPDGELVVDDLIRGRVTFSSDVIGDFIILRSDGLPSYNFAAVVDDRDMKITHVIRGDDHLTNTVRQIMLFAAVDAPPPRYAHHALILGPDGGKLSKRHGATSVGEFRDLGYLPQAIVNYLALLSWSHGKDEVLSMERLIAEFDLAALSPSAAIFDRAKLDWLDHEHILALDPAEHERLFAERLSSDTPKPAVAALAAANKPSLVAYGEAPALAAAVLVAPDSARIPGELLALVRQASEALEQFVALRAATGSPAATDAAPAPPAVDAAPAPPAADADYLDVDACRAVLAAYREWGREHGLKARDVLMPLRIALTGAEHGPELQFILAALSGRETAVRLRAALAAAEAGEPSTEAAPS